ncbi:MAG: hypothetical protein RBT46_00430 [Weeksellaceae bacterium]|nr:hypothetical protein [Weeksellaceae bacterium]
MMKKRIINPFFLVLNLFFSLSFSCVFAQIDTKIDRNHIKIGEPIQLSISIPFEKDIKIKFPVLNDTLSYHIEILDQKIDTLIDKNNTKIIHQLQITSFDPGDFLIRSLPVVINNDTLLTHSFEIQLDEVELDSANTIGFPIKPIMNEEFTWKDYWNQYWAFIVGAFLAFLLAILLLYYYFYMKKGQARLLKKQKTPYEEAKGALKALDQQKLLAKSAYYLFYSELSYIVRRYLGRVYEFSSLELLSDDLIEYLKIQTTLEAEDILHLKQFLYDSDLVKYAKAIPEEEKHEFYRKWIGELVEKIKPIETETEYSLKPNEKIRKIR